MQFLSILIGCPKFFNQSESSISVERNLKNGPTSASFFVYFCSFQAQILQKQLQASVGSELRSSKQTLTTTTTLKCNLKLEIFFIGSAPSRGSLPLGRNMWAGALVYSRSKGRGFKSWHHILDGQFFHIYLL